MRIDLMTCVVAGAMLATALPAAAATPNIFRARNNRR